MLIKIEGTDYTRRLVKEVVTDLQNKGPVKNHIEYSAQRKCKSKRDYADFYTTENKGELSNVSLIIAKRIRAAIGNKTGNILIEKKPFFMSKKKVLSQIYEFLEQLLPEKVKDPKKTEFDVLCFDPDFEEFRYNTPFDTFSIKKVITANNHASSADVRKDYIDL